MSQKWAIATEIHVAWRAGDQGESGLVVLNVSFVARDPDLTLTLAQEELLCFDTPDGDPLSRFHPALCGS